VKQENGNIYLSASDLVGHLNCNHLSALDLQVVTGALEKPDYYDPLLEILRERGFRHEQDYIEHLRSQQHEIAFIIEGEGINDKTVDATLTAMREGKDIIVQAVLRHGRWTGRPDILRRVSLPSSFGDWSYEVIDTKLARETKGGSVLQLCLYADLLSHIQGIEPENLYIVSPWTDFEAQVFRYQEFAAYFRRVKRSTEIAVDATLNRQTYPDPKAHCDICRWRNDCDQKRRADDHLCLVANISKGQIAELQENDIDTRHALGELSSIPFRPRRGSPLSLEKARAQAAIQVKALRTGKNEIEFLDVVPETGFAALPEPSEGDIFFDIESDQFVGEEGIEYLFGYISKDEDGQFKYVAEWAFNRASEKAAFEWFVDFVKARRERYPDLHIYHFAPYEPGALKRLMGRYATREEDIDNFLRGKVFVDLLSVVRNALRASVESYSLKKLEAFFSFNRRISLHDANVALTKLSAGLELDDIPSIDDKTKETIQGYNADDCFSTLHLRDWLENLRDGQIAKGFDIPRPAPGQDGPSEEIDEKTRKVRVLIDRLTHDVPVDIEERTEEQQARWILAYLLEWHRREEKAKWWEFFRLSELTVDELVSEKAALGHLSLVGQVDATPTGIPVHRYQFEQQDTDIRGDEDVRQTGGETLGSVVSINAQERTIDIKKSRATADVHPDGVFVHKIIRGTEQAASLFRLGEYVSEHGIEGEGHYRSAHDLLLRKRPYLGGQVIQEDKDSLAAAIRIIEGLDKGVLPIQGPPGTGKSYTGARMICSLVKQGRKVGITANSHKVIRNLIDKTIEAADEMGIDVHCIQKPGKMEPNTGGLSFAAKNDHVFSALSSGCAHVAGATHFLWSRAEAKDAVDVLVVDEAAQMSLANVAAIGQAAPAIVLLGDPQQLEQPTQGSHPDGTGVSALDHILGGRQTILSEQGLFLPKTWRMHPKICVFNSEQFYEEKLKPIKGCELQEVISNGLFNGSGLRYVPVHHTGNTSSSPEEARMVQKIVEEILGSCTKWTNREGKTKDIAIDDILIIAPYNAQVFEVQQLLPMARVGTVDKFQGQEAPITIYSMATSSHADAPRGMEFLYSSNRLNVAISRAQCLTIVVASPQVFEAECRTPRQMQLANAHCRYIELADEVTMETQ